MVGLPGWVPPPQVGSAGGVGTQTPTTSQSHQQSQNESTNQSYGSQQSTSFIPDYSQTPILNSIAQYAQNMAPQVYNWGMEQWGKNQGNIDAMMRAGLTYASPQRVKNEMGMAEAGVQQGAEQGRQSAIRDLESYGIDPSSGRYQQLDNASRVMAGASAAGAGNQQRMATEAQGNAMQQQALSAGLQNTAMGYGASSAMKGLLDTGMSLKYSPLGTQSQGVSGSSGQSTGFSQGESFSGKLAAGGEIPDSAATGYGSNGNATTGGFVSQELSPSAGSAVDDVDARLNAGEFVIPKDVVEFKGKEFFYKLMAQSRKIRATMGDNGGGQEQPPAGGQATGYQAGGGVDDNVSRWLQPPEGASPYDYLPGTGIPRGSFSKGFEQQMDLDARAQRTKDFQTASDAKYGARPQEYWDQLNQQYPAPLPWSVQQDNYTGRAPGPQTGYNTPDPDIAPRQPKPEPEPQRASNPELDQGGASWHWPTGSYSPPPEKSNPSNYVRFPGGQVIDIANSPDFIAD